MAAETGFTINGKIYERPDISTLKMKERRRLYELTGFALEDLVQGEHESDREHEDRVGRMTNHPGFMEAMLHIAYQRGNPNLAQAEVQEVVDDTDYLLAMSTVGEAVDADPPALTTEPGEASPNGSDASSESSGPDSPTGSGLQVVIPLTTTTSRSATS